MNGWLSAARTILDRIEASQSQPIEETSLLCARVIGAGGLVHLFGSGHSRIPLEEMFPRYGSYSGFRPIVEPALTQYAGVVGPGGLEQAMFVERTPGLAEKILTSCAPQADDALIVFSFSGRSTVSVEIASGARARGLPVVAVTGDPAGADGALGRHADIVVDLCVPAGDALCSLAGGVPVGPGSTLAYVAVVNIIKVRTAELLVENGLLPPVIRHADVAGRELSEASIRAALEDQRRRMYRHDKPRGAS